MGFCLHEALKHEKLLYQPCCRMYAQETTMFKTSNVISHHRGPKPFRFGLVTEHVTTMHFISMGLPLMSGKFYFSSSSVVLLAFSELCAYSKFGHHPHHLDYLCAKFRFSRTSHCWDSPRRKIAYLISHSITHPAFLMCREAKLSLRNKLVEVRTCNI